MRRRNRNGVRKERIIMLTTSVLVLTVLTVTGVFVRRSNKAEREDYVVDFEAIEQGADMTAENMMSGEDLDTLFAEVGTDDLDYDPSFQEANSQNVENTADKSGTDQSVKKTGNATAPVNTGQKSDSGLGIGSDQTQADTATGTAKKDTQQETRKDTAVRTADQSQEDQEGMFDETVDTAAATGEQEAAEAIATTVQPVLDFKEEDGLVWPIVGDVLINYSMDKTIYFPTLQQYKYNPAIVIAAAQGAEILAAANGHVNSVGYDPVIGNNVVMDLGNGYELTYGQLENITVSEGSYVNVGDKIGTVASPTKYYSVEGTNVYFKLTKDGEPVNPMSQLH